MAVLGSPGLASSSQHVTKHKKNAAATVKSQWAVLTSADCFSAEANTHIIYIRIYLNVHIFILIHIY
jgi:hypothetical protein